MVAIDFSRIKVLLVDMDNTLCDTYHTLTIRQWNRVADAFERKGRKDVARALRRRVGKQSFVSMLKDLSLTTSEMRFAIRVYDQNPVGSLRLFEDAPALLELPVPKVLLSRGEPALQRRKIRHLRIAKHFEDVIIIDTFAKKDDAMRDFLRRRRLRPAEVLVIGDRLEEEIMAAKKLKMPAVLVRRPDWPVAKVPAKPDLTVRSLAALAKRISAVRS